MVGSRHPTPLRSLTRLEDPNDTDEYSDANRGDSDDQGNEPDENFPPPDPDEPAPHPDNYLAVSLTHLADKISAISLPPKTRSKVRQRAPDVFDGTDPGKLDTFIFQCSMYISARTSDFPDSESRVSFALSYLHGIPLDWFQGEFASSSELNGSPPLWFNSYPAFLAELRHIFGPRDPVGDATNAIEGLKYKDSTKAARYTIKFNRHAHRTGWNDMALTRQYYKALPDRLKDEITRIGKPADLGSLQELVAVLDQRFWERQSEISRDKQSTLRPPNIPSTPSNFRQTPTPSEPAPSVPTSADFSTSNPKFLSDNNSAMSPVTATISAPSLATRIADLLGSDGKLKPEERQRRMDNGLCLGCGKPGHMVANCPRKNFPDSAGRASTAVPVPNDSETSSESGSDSGSDFN